MNDKNKESQDTEDDYELTEADQEVLDSLGYLSMACLLFGTCFILYTEVYAAPDFESQLGITRSYEKELADPNKIDCFRKGLPEYYEVKTIGDLKDAYYYKYAACK